MSILLHGHHANDERCPLSFDMDTAARVKQIETHTPRLPSRHRRPHEDSPMPRLREADALGRDGEGEADAA